MSATEFAAESTSTIRPSDSELALNPQQLAVVSHGLGPLLVVAGAGSGKTRVIVERVARLIDDGTPPERILVVTFTNLAARELKERLTTRVGPIAQALSAGTFHWVGQRLLRRYGSRLDIGSRFRIVTPLQSLTLIRRLVKQYPQLRESVSATDLRDAIEAYRITGTTDVRSSDIPSLTAEYIRVLRAESALDIDDLILEPVSFLQQHSGVRDSLRRWFRHVLVDEFQDTNQPQIEMLRLLTGPGGNIMAVGDDDQSIYGWRYAELKNMTHFSDWFPTAVTRRLEHNYRSSPRILRVANALSAHNACRIEKRLFSTRAPGPMPTVFGAGDENEEAVFVISELTRLLRHGLPPSEAAILYRVNALSRSPESSLARAGIAYVIRSGKRFYDRPEVARVMCGLRVVDDPGSQPAWIDILRHIPGIGPAKSVQYAPGAASVTIDQPAPPRLPPSVKSLAAELRGISASCGGHSRPPNLGDMIQGVNRALTAVCGAVGSSDLERESAEANIGELVAAAFEFEAGRATSAGPVVPAFLDHVSLAEPEDDSPGVQLMTLHAAKGLEFDAVFIIGIDEGVLPHKRAMRSIDQVDEERRLLYVGITRARSHLYMSYTRTRGAGALSEPAVPSRFIDEIPAPLIKVEHGVSDATRKRLPSVSVGERVVHPRWGAGTVTIVKGRGRETMVSITFDSGPTQRVQLCHAPLERATRA